MMYLYTKFELKMSMHNWDGEKKLLIDDAHEIF